LYRGEGMNRRVIYALEPFALPGGGPATIYRHVEILNAHGLSAFVALPGKPPVDFYGTTAPLLIHDGRLPTQAGDIWVTPEGFAGYVEALMQMPVKRLMFCQNQYYLPFTKDPRAGIAEFGVHGVIGSSEAVRTFFRDVYGVQDLPILPYAIDPTRFRSAAAKRRQVAFMPRKLRQDAAFIEAAFKRRHPRFADVPWVPIDKATQAVAAHIMGESAVFLSLSHKESFGLPPLEAMACGCLVAGYHGGGGREYMMPENGWWAETGDWMACVDGIAAALETYDKRGAELDQRRVAMEKTVARYSPGRLEAELIAFWRRELSTPFP
jgi:Glycosyl transferases group 1